MRKIISENSLFDQRLNKLERNQIDSEIKFEEIVADILSSVSKSPTDVQINQILEIGKFRAVSVEINNINLLKDLRMNEHVDHIESNKPMFIPY